MTANDQSSIIELLQRVPAAFFRQKSGGAFAEIGGGFELLTGLPASAVVADPSLLLLVLHEGDMESFRERTAHFAEAEGGCMFRLWHAKSGELKTIREFRRPLRG